MATRKLIIEVVGESSSLERALGRSTKATQTFGREFSKAERGVLSGSGAFRSLGRTAAFASAAFIGTASLTQAVKSSIDAAETSARAHESLSTALKKAGEAATAQQPAIERWAQGQARFGISTNTALTGLARLVELTGSSRKAMEGYTAALEISKATGKDFNTVSLAVGKALAGQTTALARYIGKIPKGTTSLELLNRVQERYGGQAQANTLATDRLGAEITNLETVIGTALLPTVDKIATKLGDWLSKSRNQERVQRDVTTAVRDATGAFNAIKGTIQSVDEVTGSFKHTLELLLGLRVAFWARDVALGFGLLGTRAAAAEAEAVGLRAALLGLSGPEVVAGLAATYGAIKLVQNATKHTTVAPASFGPKVKVGESITSVQNDLTFLKSIGDRSSRLFETLSALQRMMLKSGSVIATASEVLAAQNAAANKLASLGALGTGRGALRTGRGTGGIPNIGPPSDQVPAAAAHALTAKQSNAFFDNAIARILLRGGLGSISQQIAALTKADGLITQRIARTKDVTRKLNLEDQLLQNQAQIGSLRAQQAANAQQAAQEAHQKAVDALARRAAARTSRQFRELGFTGTGDDVIPAVPRLKKELAAVGDAVKGTKFDTPALESKLANIRKVLAEGIVPRDVRSRIQDMFSQIRDGLKQGTGELTKGGHVNSNAILAGLGLSPEQTRQLRERISQIGPGGTVPGQHSAAFSGAGADQTIVLQVDGREVTRVVTKRQQKTAKARTSSRRGK